MGEDQVERALEEQKGQNQVIEDLMRSLKNEHPQFDVILSKLVDW